MSDIELPDYVECPSCHGTIRIMGITLDKIEKGVFGKTVRCSGCNNDVYLRYRVEE